MVMYAFVIIVMSLAFYVGSQSMDMGKESDNYCWIFSFCVGAISAFVFITMSSILYQPIRMFSCTDLQKLIQDNNSLCSWYGGCLFWTMSAFALQIAANVYMGYSSEAARYLDMVGSCLAASIFAGLMFAIAIAQLTIGSKIQNQLKPYNLKKGKKR